MGRLSDFAPFTDLSTGADRYRKTVKAPPHRQEKGSGSTCDSNNGNRAQPWLHAPKSLAQPHLRFPDYRSDLFSLRF